MLRKARNATGISREEAKKKGNSKKPSRSSVNK